MPTYNRAEYIAKTIDSVLGQSFVEFELIIVDDGSTDNTKEIVLSFSDARIQYFYKENEERAVARNYGMDRSKGKYITFLDSDDLYYACYLSNAFESITAKDYPPFFHLAYEVINTRGKVLRKISNLKDGNINILAKGNPLSCMGIFVKADVPLRFNIDRQLSGSEDWEFWLRMAANYGLRTDNRISAALIDHSNRSVFNFDEKALVKRKDLSLTYAFKDPAVKKVFGPKIKEMEAWANTYIALHLSLSRKDRLAWHYLRLAFKESPSSVFCKRGLVIIKKTFINLVKKCVE